MTFEEIPEVPASIKGYMAHVIKEDEGITLTKSSNDPGGLTYYGMTYKTFHKIERRWGESTSAEGFEAAALSGSELLLQRIFAAYYLTFWQKLRLTDLAAVNPQFAKAAFSAVINLGIQEGTILLQTAILNTKAGPHDEKFQGFIDGIVGERTVACFVHCSLANKGPDVMREFRRLWLKKYADIVQENCETWDAYIATLENQIEQPELKLVKLKPRYKRWKYLEGWLERAQRWV